MGLESALKGLAENLPKTDSSEFGDNMNICDNCKKQLQERMAEIALNYKNKSKKEIEEALAVATFLIATIAAKKEKVSG